ncbi:SgcJ/EcaC family oxidoreductase [Myceligenerans xiligouense]|uniref:Uncharacterized protein (TIGR02246 family) n=1 Tax=Myceligenerans xiligouense TaxID=253184 RepID=A0A3N4YHZ2_9MICO|nr:SgcJ/EcaC family oxidoreductase [Myceligenerans xiligouense]RPF19727.1 uncharacterized protein (TIGR02246 family) [Myceligenerans xiligouense]
MATTTDDPAAVPQRIIEAWRDHDAEAFAEVFTKDGTMILPGVHQKGQDAIAAFMRQAFQGPYRGTQVLGTPFDVKVLGPDAVILFTEGGVRPAGADELPDDALVRATWVVVREDGVWQLASYSNAPKQA